MTGLPAILWYGIRSWECSWHIQYWNWTVHDSFKISVTKIGSAISEEDWRGKRVVQAGCVAFTNKVLFFNVINEAVNHGGMQGKKDFYWLTLKCVSLVKHLGLVHAICVELRWSAQINIGSTWGHKKPLLVRPVHAAIWWIIVGSTVSKWLGHQTLHLWGPRFESHPKALPAWSLHVAPLLVWVFSGCSGFHPHYKVVQIG